MPPVPYALLPATAVAYHNQDPRGARERAEAELGRSGQQVHRGLWLARCAVAR